MLWLNTDYKTIAKDVVLRRLCCRRSRVGQQAARNRNQEPGPGHPTRDQDLQRTNATHSSVAPTSVSRHGKQIF